MVMSAPDHETSSPKNVVVSHGVGAVIGWAMLGVFGLHGVPCGLAMDLSWTRVAAVAASLAATNGVVRAIRCTHPPAGATTMIVSIGGMPLARHILDFELAAMIVGRLGFRRPQGCRRRVPAPARARERVKAYKLVLEYAGTRFSGWQEQKNAVTVAGELRKAIEAVAGPVEDLARGRQDGRGRARARAGRAHEARARPRSGADARSRQRAPPGGTSTCSRSPRRTRGSTRGTRRSRGRTSTRSRGGGRRSRRSTCGGCGAISTSRGCGTLSRGSRASATSRSSATSRRKGSRRASAWIARSSARRARSSCCGSRRRTSLWRMVRRLTGALVEGRCRRARAGGFRRAPRGEDPARAPGQGREVDRAAVGIVPRAGAVRGRSSVLAHRAGVPRPLESARPP